MRKYSLSMCATRKATTSILRLERCCRELTSTRFSTRGRACPHHLWAWRALYRVTVISTIRIVRVTLPTQNVVTDTRPSPRVKDPVLLKLLKLEYDECEISGETTDLHLHHVILKSQGGDDLRCNIICMQESIHTLYHAGDKATRLLVARHVDEERPDVGCYIAEKLGGAPALLEWFSRHGFIDQQERTTNG